MSPRGLRPSPLPRPYHPGRKRSAYAGSTISRWTAQGRGGWWCRQGGKQAGGTAKRHSFRFVGSGAPAWFSLPWRRKGGQFGSSRFSQRVFTRTSTKVRGTLRRPRSTRPSMRRREPTLAITLLKSLYRLKQSPSIWYGIIDPFVVRIGFKALKIGLKSLASGPCVYSSDGATTVKQGLASDNGSTAILALFVADVRAATTLRSIYSRDT